MSDTEQSISRYTTGDLRERLHAALRGAGKEPAVLQPADLEEADQFHSGGKAATLDVAKAVGIGLGTRVLDVGSGIGGPARAFATLGAVVTGVDVTNEFVVLARELNAACGMAGSITMVQAPAQDTGLPDGSFDAATMIHVGMNIADKAAVFAEVHRLLRPGGVFGIYDLMGTNDTRLPDALGRRRAKLLRGIGRCLPKPAAHGGVHRHRGQRPQRTGAETHGRTGCRPRREPDAARCPDPAGQRSRGPDRQRGQGHEVRGHRTPAARRRAAGLGPVALAASRPAAAGSGGARHPRLVAGPGGNLRTSMI